MYHGKFPESAGTSCTRVAARGLVATNSTHFQRNCTEHVQLTYSRRRSPGGVITSQTTLCRNFGGKGWGAYFRRGRISGTLRYYFHIYTPSFGVWNIL